MLPVAVAVAFQADTTQRSVVAMLISMLPVNARATTQPQDLALVTAPSPIIN